MIAGRISIKVIIAKLIEFFGVLKFIFSYFFCIKQMKKSITCVGMFQQMPWKPPYDKGNKKYGQQNHVEHQLLGAYAFIYHGLSKIFLITIKRGCFFILTNDQLSFMSNSNIGKSNILKF